MMTFSHTSRNLKGDIDASITYTVYNDASIHEVMQDVRRFLLAVSFHPDVIEEYIEAE